MNRRYRGHRTRGGAFQGMTQRIDSENELITCDVNGRLLTWDCDYREPVQVGVLKRTIPRPVTFQSDFNEGGEWKIWTVASHRLKKN